MAMNPQMGAQMSPDVLTAMVADPSASPSQRMAALSVLKSMQGGAPSPAPLPNMQGDSTGISTMHPAFAAAVRDEVSGGAAAPAAAPADSTPALMSGAADANRVASGASGAAAGGMARGGAVRGYAGGGQITSDLDPATMTGGAMDPGAAGVDENDPNGYYEVIRKQLRGGPEKLSGSDKWMALLEASLGTMAAAGQPGATFLGSVGRGGLEGVEGLRKVQAQRAEERMRNASLAGNLASHDESVQARKDALAQQAEQRDLDRQARADNLREQIRSREKEGQDNRDLRLELARLVNAGKVKNPTDGLPEGTGDEFLSALPEADREVVRKLANGDLLPTTLSPRNDYRNRMIAAAMQFDPKMNQGDIITRYKTKQDFGTQGMSGRNITAANTMVKHMGDLLANGEKMGNVDWPVIGKGVNYLKQAAKSAGSNPALSGYEMSSQAVADEMEKVMRGSAGSLSGTEAWKKNLSKLASPQELVAAAVSGANLMLGRMDELAANKNRVMGGNETPLDLISPGARAQLGEINKRAKAFGLPGIKGLEEAKPDSAAEVVTPDAGAAGAAEPTQADLEHTAQVNGITVDEVKRRLAAKNKAVP